MEKVLITTSPIVRYEKTDYSSDKNITIFWVKYNNKEYDDSLVTSFLL
jgi:hypothetical protein